MTPTAQPSLPFWDPVEYFDLLDCQHLISPRVPDSEELEQQPSTAVRRLGEVVRDVESLDGYRTCNPSFYLELLLGQKSLEGYFGNNRTSKRPLNCLLLGPPGSGKTFLAKKLGHTLENSMFLDYNLAQCDHPGQIAEMFHEIGQTGRRTEAPKIVFLDEFDVTIGGTSMIRYLIHSMYEGKFGEGQDLKKTVFIFSGSYLKNKQLLSVLQRNASDFDFIHFLYDIYLHLPNRPAERRQIRDFFYLSLKYREARNQLSPDRDALDYLRRLDKLVDFLSRINGFVIEIPDVSAPLELTEAPFCVGSRETNDSRKKLRLKRLMNRSVARDVLNFVQAKEELRLQSIQKPSAQADQSSYPLGAHLIREYRISHHEPILEFKNMLLCERLARVVMMLEEKYASSNCKKIRISRKLLNYLSVAPLIHGMRSLEYLISLTMIDEDKSNLVQLRQAQLNDEIARMHVRMEGEYYDDDSVWTAMRKANPDAFDHEKHRAMKEEHIEIVLDNRSPGIKPNKK